MTNVLIRRDDVVKIIANAMGNYGRLLDEIVRMEAVIPEGKLLDSSADSEKVAHGWSDSATAPEFAWVQAEWGHTGTVMATRTGNTWNYVDPVGGWLRLGYGAPRRWRLRAESAPVVDAWITVELMEGEWVPVRPARVEDRQACIERAQLCARDDVGTVFGVSAVGGPVETYTASVHGDIKMEKRAA